jgi:hypothetical protein
LDCLRKYEASDEPEPELSKEEKLLRERALWDTNCAFEADELSPEN